MQAHEYSSVMPTLEAACTSMHKLGAEGTRSIVELLQVAELH